MCVCVCVCVCACVRVRACLRARVLAHVRAYVKVCFLSLSLVYGIGMVAGVVHFSSSPSTSHS